MRLLIYAVGCLVAAVAGVSVGKIHGKPIGLLVFVAIFAMIGFIDAVLEQRGD